MPPAEVLGLRALARATLARQLLLARQSTTLDQVTERLMGLQSQWPKPPFVGLWTRMKGFRRASLVKASMAREVVRATMMRGTIDLVSRRDFVALRRAIQPVLTGGVKSILRGRLEQVDVERVLAEARAFLEEEPRTFAEVRDHLVGLHPRGDERAMGFVVRMLLPLVLVPAESSTWAWPANADFAVAESFLGCSLAEDDAPDALMLRYLAAFGPATVADAQTWSGMRGLSPVFERLRPRLVTFRDAKKKELFDLPDAPRPDEDVAAPVRFIPDFDNLLLGHADRTRIVSAEHGKKVFFAAQRVHSIFLVDGVAAGLWDIERKKATAEILLQPFGKLTKKLKDELAEEASALVRFVEADAASFDVRFTKA